MKFFASLVVLVASLSVSTVNAVPKPQIASGVLGGLAGAGIPGTGLAAGITGGLGV
jgi:hypothetical protein